MIDERRRQIGKFRQGDERYAPGGGAGPNGSTALPGGFHRALHADWNASHPVAALSCLPAVMLIIGGGLLFDEPMLRLVAATGAFSAGFGVFQRLSRIEMLPMLRAASGMTVSAALGTLAGVTPWVEALVAAVWAFAVGLTAILGTAAWWITLQWAIALIVAASFPADAAHALLRGALVAVGAVTQLILTPMLWRLVGRHFAEVHAPQAREIELPQLRSALRQALRWGSPNLRHAAALAIAVGASTILFRKTDLPNGYWMPMTVLIVLRSSFNDTVAFALARIAGTVAGAGFVTLAIALSRPSMPYLILFSAAFAWGCYSVLRVNQNGFRISLERSSCIG